MHSVSSGIDYSPKGSPRLLLPRGAWRSRARRPLNLCPGAYVQRAGRRATIQARTTLASGFSAIQPRALPSIRRTAERLTSSGIPEADTLEGYMGSLFAELKQDLRLGLRLLIKNPGFTVISVLTLALGIGATSAIFSVLDAVVLSPLPFRDPDRLVLLQEVDARGRTRTRPSA